MTKERYKELLLDSRWKKKRDKILKRDGYKCSKCKCKDSLQVHHLWYLEDGMPWDVPNEWLITLCRIHHEEAHKGKDIKEFIRKSSKKKKKKNTNKKHKSKSSKMSTKDSAIQARYNRLRQEGKII